MRRMLRVAGATLNQMPLAWRDNRRRIIEAMQAARQAKAAVLCLPELCVSGYGCEDMFNSPHMLDECDASLREILPASKGLVVVLGAPLRYQGYVYNCAVVMQDGHLLGVNPKKLLPREGVHYEARWFQPWPAGVRAEVSLCGKQVPFGDLAYDFEGVRIAIEICEEAWHATPAASEHVRAGAQIVLNPSASHFAFGKHLVRERLVTNSSRSLQVHYVYTNLVGLEAGRMLYDGGVIIASCGSVQAHGPRFGFAEMTLTAADIDLDLATVGRLSNRAVHNVSAKDVQMTPIVNGRGFVTPVILRRSRRISDCRDSSASPQNDGDKTTELPVTPEHPATVFAGDKNTDFLRAETLALFDYMRRARAKGFVVSLSGGIDSACVALLAAQMWALALEAFGSGAALAKHVHLSAPKADPDSAAAWIREYVTCVYQKTVNSSAQTETAARALATAMGATFYVVDVQPMVDAYTRTFEQSTGNELTWQKDDLTLQNIQARARAPMAWMYANHKQALLLATCNRSEVAVGYATMDGDTAGGLSPLAGVDKRFLREWIAWAETSCSLGLGPIAALSQITKLPPTAELRPATEQQRDEDDLMPYAVLERIERLLIRDKMAPANALAHLQDEFPDIAAQQLQDYIAKFTRLWVSSQWKRERYAPAFHMDDESLDPKTWCRFPILSAGWDG